MVEAQVSCNCYEWANYNWRHKPTWNFAVSATVEGFSGGVTVQNCVSSKQGTCAGRDFILLYLLQLSSRFYSVSAWGKQNILFRGFARGCKVIWSPRFGSHCALLLGCIISFTWVGGVGTHTTPLLQHDGYLLIRLVWFIVGLDRIFGVEQTTFKLLISTFLLNDNEYISPYRTLVQWGLYTKRKQVQKCAVSDLDE